MPQRIAARELLDGTLPTPPELAALRAWVPKVRPCCCSLPDTQVVDAPDYRALLLRDGVLLR